MALEATSTFSAESFYKSLSDVLGHEARQLHHMVNELEQVVGADHAAPVIDEAFSQFGMWRAKRIIEAVADDEGIKRTLESWPDGYIYAITNLGWGSINLNDNGYVIRVNSAPDLDILIERNRPDLYLQGWRELLKSISSLLKLNLPEPVTEWDADSQTATIWVQSAPSPGRDLQLAPQTLSRLSSLLASTIENRAGQYHFFAQAAMKAFDASGEHAVRRAIQEFGKERGRALREEHEKKGRTLNLETMMSDFDYGGEGVWQFDPGSLEPSSWSQDCTYCPFAEVWRELDGGLETGYIYDMEFHVAEFREYNPNIRVVWDKLQTRGDSVCAFRFTMPEAS